MHKKTLKYNLQIKPNEKYYVVTATTTAKEESRILKGRKERKRIREGLVIDSGKGCQFLVGDHIVFDDAYPFTVNDLEILLVHHFAVLMKIERIPLE